jgi:lipoprotein-anchoring transpeptidase ErfK/SrfK
MLRHSPAERSRTAHGNRGRRARHYSVPALFVLAAMWSGAASASPAVAPSQALVTLVASQSAHAAPHENGTSMGSIPADRPITGVKTVLPVVGRAAGGWLRVELPGRPNGRLGWIRSASTIASTTPWHVVVQTGARRVLVYRDGRVVTSFPAVVGKPSTPTPLGTLFVEEAVRLSPSDPGAPFALALSARSNVLQEFDGGPGQIALHGVANLGGVPGTAVSHGCVRLTAAAMGWLVSRIGAGVPVTIVQ